MKKEWKNPEISNLALEETKVDFVDADGEIAQEYCACANRPGGHTCPKCGKGHGSHNAYIKHVNECTVILQS